MHDLYPRVGTINLRKQIADYCILNHADPSQSGACKSGNRRNRMYNLLKKSSARARAFPGRSYWPYSVYGALSEA
jgi:hypothetical protein